MCYEQLSSKYVYNIEIGLFIGLETFRIASQVFKKTKRSREKNPLVRFYVVFSSSIRLQIFYWPLNAERLNKK